MNCFPVTVVLVAVAQTLLAAVLSGSSHLTNGQEMEENLVISRRRAMNEHDHKTDAGYSGILGSEEDLDDLNPSEIIQRLKSILEIMDQNKNGFIEKNELVDKLLESYKKLSIEESDSEFQTSDIDEDGFVTWEEYAGNTYNNPEDDNDDVTKEEKEIFKMADINKDGKLNKNEFRSFYSPEDHDQMKSILVSGVMSRFDTNNDGKITFEEFSGSQRFDHDSKWLEQERHTFENTLDIDKNGVLEGNELHSWASPSNSEMADSEAENLIAKTDKNGDGVLSYDEVLDNHKAFISPDSEAYHLFKDEL